MAERDQLLQAADRLCHDRHGCAQVDSLRIEDLCVADGRGFCQLCFIEQIDEACRDIQRSWPRCERIAFCYDEHHITLDPIIAWETGE